MSASIAKLGLVLVAALAACDGDEGSGRKARTVTPTSKKAAEEQVTPEGAPSDFSYSPIGKRDPFQSYLQELGESLEGSPERQRKKEPTEAFELDQYKLTALVTGTSQPRAMVEDPEGKGHTIKIGARLGKRGGIVTRISTDGIVVTEEIGTPTGERVRVPIAVRLPQPELDMNEQQ